MKVNELKKADLILNLSGVLPNGTWNSDYNDKTLEDAEFLDNKLVDEYRLRATTVVGKKDVVVKFKVSRFSFGRLQMNDTNDLLIDGKWVITDAVMLSGGTKYEFDGQEKGYTPDTNEIWGQMSKLIPPAITQQPKAEVVKQLEVAVDEFI